MGSLPWDPSVPSGGPLPLVPGPIWVPKGSPPMGCLGFPRVPKPPMGRFWETDKVNVCYVLQVLHVWLCWKSICKRPGHSLRIASWDYYENRPRRVYVFPKACALSIYSISSQSVDSVNSMWSGSSMYSMQSSLDSMECMHHMEPHGTHRYRLHGSHGDHEIPFYFLEPPLLKLVNPWLKQE